MKAIPVLKVLGGVVLVGVGTVLALTNPSRDTYEAYAVEQLSAYLKEEVCTQAPKAFGDVLVSQCKTLIDTGRPQIQQIIAQRTKRHNFMVFSIYETNLDFGSALPAYEFETLGVLDQFYIYQAEEL